MTNRDTEDSADRFADNGEYVWGRIADVLLKLNLPISQDHAQESPTNEPSKHFFLEGSRRHRLDFYVALTQKDPTRYECELHLTVENLGDYPYVREKFRVTRPGDYPIQAFESCLELTQQALSRLFTRSDFTMTEVQQIAKGLQLPREWEAKVSYDGWQPVLDVLHKQQEKVIARIRFSNRQMIRSSLEVAIDPHRLDFKSPLEKETTRDTSFILSPANRLALYKDYIVLALFEDEFLTDLLESREAFLWWSERVFDQMRYSRGQFGFLDRLRIPSSALPKRMPKSYFENTVDGYRSGELWEKYTRPGLEDFLDYPGESDY